MIALARRYPFEFFQRPAVVMASMKQISSTSVSRKEMFSMEDKLPSLPVPPLKQTMEKYIHTLEPIMFENEYEHTKKVVAEFQKPGGIGELLQSKLLDKAKNNKNWLADWWDNCAYFGFRAPVVINSSPGIVFPKQTFHSDLDQYRYAAKLIHTVLDFKDLIDNESLPVDYAGKSPLTMHQYRKLLSVCRIPKPRQDGEVITPAEESRNIIVSHNGHMFSLDVFKHGSNERLSEDELVVQFKNIVDSSQYEEESPVGALTAQDRNVWTQAYRRLCKDSQNEESLDKIIKSICLICLDQPKNIPEGYEGAKYEDVDLSVSCAHMLHGGGSRENSINRWNDKICQFIVNRDGTVGICYEHSAAEGPPVMALCNAVMNMKFEPDSSYNLHSGSNIQLAEKLKWNLSSDLVDRIELALDFIDSSCDDVEVRLFKFTDFGKNVPKQFKISPDAFFQVSLQLAYYRLHMHHPPTYESASIRKYPRGRTETIRSATPEAARYVREMDRTNYNMSEKRSLFMKAINAHVQYTVDATNFQAIDRHLLGLRLTAAENNIPLPEIFRDKAFGYAMHFRLSTSQVPTKYEACLCFGPVVPDGYGVCYNPMENQFVYAVSEFNSHPKTVAADLGEYISTALKDNHVLLASQSKL